MLFFKTHLSVLWLLASDDGTGPEKIAHIMGPPDRCEHAARIINDLLQSLRVGGFGVCCEPPVRIEGTGTSLLEKSRSQASFLCSLSISSLSCRVVLQALQGVLACPRGVGDEEGARATGALLGER